ncbi:MAG: sigma-70 family RNA polymerase sigma factor [Treponema sp.]|nr:sigma-70 family RNA polymerase sigma factor [Treponema sp.]
MAEKTKRKKTNNTLAIYLHEINLIPMLSRDEEEATARAVAAGNKAAREKLISANLRFVITVAKRYQGLGLPLEDLVNEGNLGLISAADRFDVNKGYHFISYAVWWIRQAILSALCEKTRMIRLPVNRAADLVKIEKAGKLIEMQLSPEEEINEIADILNMDKVRVANLLGISREILSLDNTFSNRGEVLLMDFVEDSRYASPENIVEQVLLRDDINTILNTLEKDEADIIRCHYGLGRQPMSLKEIGACYNLSKERIRQIEERALTRLRNPIRADKLRTYVA